TDKPPLLADVAADEVTVRERNEVRLLHSLTKPAPSESSRADRDERLLELIADGLRRRAWMHERGHTVQDIGQLFDLRKAERQTHRPERDEMAHARSTDEEDERHQQCEKHRDGHVGLESGEQIEHADHDEERHQSLRESAECIAL